MGKIPPHGMHDHRFDGKAQGAHAGGQINGLKGGKMPASPAHKGAVEGDGDVYKRQELYIFSMLDD